MVTTAGLATPTFGVLSLVGYAIFVIAMIVLAYLTTKFVANLYSKGLNSRNIKVLEKIYLAADKSLWLVELGNKIYFVYADKNGMTKLDTLNRDEIDLIKEDSTRNTHNFKDILNKYMKGSQSSDEQ